MRRDKKLSNAILLAFLTADSWELSFHHLTGLHENDDGIFAHLELLCDEGLVTRVSGEPGLRDDQGRKGTEFMLRLTAQGHTAAEKVRNPRVGPALGPRL